MTVPDEAMVARYRLRCARSPNGEHDLVASDIGVVYCYHCLIVGEPVFSIAEPPKPTGPQYQPRQPPKRRTAVRVAGIQRADMEHRTATGCSLSEGQRRLRRCLERGDPDVCYLCGYALSDVASNRTVDHVVALVRGGSDHLDNWRLCCFDCNNAKGERDLDEYLRSTAGTDPA